MKTLREWLGLCKHQYETLHFFPINSVSVVTPSDPGITVGTNYVLRCKYCGIIKQKKVLV